MLVLFLGSLFSSVGVGYGKSIQDIPCLCAGMNSSVLGNHTVSLVEHSLTGNLTSCGPNDREKCNQLCKGVATAIEHDPIRVNQICNDIKKNITAHISVFSKICDEDYMYTGLTFSEPLCCENGKEVKCKILDLMFKDILLNDDDVTYPDNANGLVANLSIFLCVFVIQILRYLN